jgi:hypothetical protein
VIKCICEDNFAGGNTMGTLIYIAGVLTGAGIMMLHNREVTKAINAERMKYQGRLRELETERRTADCADAYRRGKNDGKNSPATAAERFAKTFEDRRVQFKGAK